MVIKAIILSSLARQESRGAIQREDYPQRGGTQFLKRVPIKIKGAQKDLGVNWGNLYY